MHYKEEARRSHGRSDKRGFKRQKIREVPKLEPRSFARQNPGTTACIAKTHEYAKAIRDLIACRWIQQHWLPGDDSTLPGCFCFFFLFAVSQ